MNIGYFGGTFDPVHNGHLALARAALETCHLDRVLFVPTDAPPHKRRKPVTSFIHRYTMVTLALNEARERNFLPSLLAQPGPAPAKSSWSRAPVTRWPRSPMLSLSHFVPEHLWISHRVAASQRCG